MKFTSKRSNLQHLIALTMGCVVLTGMASAQTVYHDGFGYTGSLTGTKPDTKDTNSNVWEAGDSAGGWSAASGVATANSFYGGEFLLVNGTSGITLDGTSNFTLSADVTTAASGGNGIGIVLGSSNHDTGGYFTGSNDTGTFLAQLGLGNDTVLSASGTVGENSTSVTSGTGNLTLSYNAAAGAIAYEYNGTTEYTLTGVTDAQIAALSTVGVGQGAFSGGALDNFDLTIATAAPEPSTYALMIGGLGMLVFFARRRRNA